MCNSGVDPGEKFPSLVPEERPLCRARGEKCDWFWQLRECQCPAGEQVWASLPGLSAMSGGHLLLLPARAGTWPCFPLVLQTVGTLSSVTDGQVSPKKRLNPGLPFLQQEWCQKANGKPGSPCRGGWDCSCTTCSYQTPQSRKILTSKNVGQFNWRLNKLLPEVKGQDCDWKCVGCDICVSRI